MHCGIYGLNNLFSNIKYSEFLLIKIFIIQKYDISNKNIFNKSLFNFVDFIFSHENRHLAKHFGSKQNGGFCVFVIQYFLCTL